MILVTGGTGLVGSHLLYYLTQSNDKIRALYRTQKKLNTVKHVFSYYSQNAKELFNKIEWVEGDLNDIPKLEIAFENVSKVYHCAAFVSFDPAEEKIMRKVNIEGTANVVNLCISNKISKLCYVSSIAALGEAAEGELINEKSPWNPEANLSSYAITKYGGELEVWRGSQEGVDAVIVNPGVIIGPGYWKSSSGSIFYRVNKGLKYYTSGSSAYIDIHDVIKPMIKLMNGSYKNERYVLIGENMSFKQFLKLVAVELNTDLPTKLLSISGLRIASIMDWLRSKLLGKRRRLPMAMVRSLVKNQKYSNAKIKDTLEYQFKPIEQSVKECATLFIRDLR